MTKFKKTRSFYKKLPLFIKNSILHIYKKLKPLKWAFIKNSIFGNNRDPWLQGCFQWSNMSISVPMPLGSTRTVMVKTEMTKKSLESMKAKFFTFVSLGLLPPPFPLRGSRHSEGAPLLVFHQLWPGRRVRGSWSLWLVAAWWRTLLTCCLYNTIC